RSWAFLPPKNASSRSSTSSVTAGGVKGSRVSRSCWFGPVECTAKATFWYTSEPLRVGGRGPVGGTSLAELIATETGSSVVAAPNVISGVVGCSAKLYHITLRLRRLKIA